MNIEFSFESQYNEFFSVYTLDRATFEVTNLHFAREIRYVDSSTVVGLYTLRFIGNTGNTNIRLKKKRFVLALSKIVGVGTGRTSYKIFLCALAPLKVWVWLGGAYICGVVMLTHNFFRR